MSVTAQHALRAAGHDPALRRIEQRVLWPATSRVHHANPLRSDPSA